MEVICVLIRDPTVEFGRVVFVHQRVIGLGISVQNDRDPAQHIVFDYQVHFRSSSAVVYFQSDAHASEGMVKKWRGSR